MDVNFGISLYESFIVVHLISLRPDLTGIWLDCIVFPFLSETVISLSYELVTRRSSSFQSPDITFFPCFPRFGIRRCEVLSKK